MNLVIAQNFLETLADYSGGQAWFPDQQGAYDDIMKGLFQDLECEYRLVCDPGIPCDGRAHKIKVEAFQVSNDQKREFSVRVRKDWRLS